MARGCHAHSFVPQFIAGLALAACLALSALPARATNCGSLHTHYGPFDYRTDRDRLPVVERHHFTSAIEMLSRDQVKNISGELSYTLHAFPNHHRALLALVRYGQQERSLQPTRLPLSIDCFFDRAMRFRPDDTVVRVIYARHLQLTNRRDAAIEQLDLTVALAGDNGLSHFNVGLAYFEAEQFDKALARAHQAMALGYEHPGLKDMLAAKGRWADPPATPATPAATPEPASVPASTPGAAASQAG